MIFFIIKNIFKKLFLINFRAKIPYSNFYILLKFMKKESVLFKDK